MCGQLRKFVALVLHLGKPCNPMAQCGAAMGIVTGFQGPAELAKPLPEKAGGLKITGRKLF